LKWGFVGPALEEAALVFGLAHLRFTQNVARPNTSTTSSSTTFLAVKTKKTALNKQNGFLEPEQ
jgi:hypothetical protein